MIQKIMHYFYPDIQKKDLQKLLLLGFAFMIAIGTYWLMRILKDVILYKLAFPTTLGWDADAGRVWVPTIKTISPLFVFCLVLMYSKLVDLFEKHTLIYIVASFYMVIFSGLTVLLSIKHYYGDQALGKYLLAGSGIFGYLVTESYGSLVIALLWSFAISSTTSEEAQKSFPVIIAFGQFGAIIGSSLALIKTKAIWPFYALVTISLGLLMVIMYHLHKLLSQQDAFHVEKKESTLTKPTGVLNGFKLLFTTPYLMGIFIVSTFYEIAATIVEYQMNSQASIIFNDVSFKWFKGMYGLSINTLSFLIALLGTRYLIKKLGIRICLLLYPAVLGISIISLLMYYIQVPLSPSLLWVTFSVMVLIKAGSYALNNPVKEIMYIPTSKDIKFKTKSIIDMFGSRFTKMAGSQINSALNVPFNVQASIHNLMMYGSLIGLGIVGVWFVVAFYVGKKNQSLIEHDTIIE